MSSSISTVGTFPQSITIVVASDNHYAILLGALLKSLEVNHRSGEKIDFHIIDDGISSTNRKRIQSLSDQSITKIHWHRGKNIIPAHIKIPVDKSSFPITAYLRLFAPYIIPTTAKRFIFLDVDMIVRKDIATLWHLDLEGATLGAVRDLSKVVSKPYAGIANYEALGLDPESGYFNSGMLVVDPVKWRENDISNKVIQCIHDNIAHVSFADQYGLNVVFNNQWLELDPRWNCVSELDTPDPYIVHFFKVKPIFSTYTGNKAYREEFYNYLRLTPWKNHQSQPDYIRLYWKALNKLKKIINGFTS